MLELQVNQQMQRKKFNIVLQIQMLQQLTKMEWLQLNLQEQQS